MQTDKKDGPDRLRKRRKTAGAAADKSRDGDDEKESSDIHTKNELGVWAGVRGIKDKETRIRSITSSMDACVREDVPGKEALLQQIDRDAKSIGILRHLVSVCLNVLAEKDPSNALLVNRTFLQQLFTRISGNQLHSRAKELHHPHLAQYLEERKLDDETLREIRGFPLRCRDAACGEMLTSIKKHISGNSQSRATEHFECELERRLWSFRDDEHFRTNITRAAKRLFESAGQKAPDRALSKIHEFTNRKRGKNKEQLCPEWRLVLEDLLPEYREIFEPLRAPRPPPDKPPKTPKTEEEMSRLEDFFFNIKAELSAVLVIEAAFRKADFNLRQRRGAIWSEIYERQPAIKPSKTKQGFLDQRHLLRVTPLPRWFEEGIDMSERDAAALVRDVAKTRKEMWNVMREPGTENPPKTFSLMPYISLTRAFVKYDCESIQVLAKSLDLPGDGANLKTEGVTRAGRSKRLWWTGPFDFHSERTVKRRPKIRRRATRATRKVLRLKNRFRRGIGLCTKDPWVTDNVRYTAKREDPACVTPWLVNSISTDGLQVKVCLATLAKTRPLSKGVGALVKKGFTGLSDARLKFSKFSNGVFQKASKLTTAEKVALPLPQNHIEVVGLDPGQVSIYATVRASVSRADKFLPESFKGSKASLSSREYRHRSLTSFSAKAETRRREQNLEYGRAIQAYDSVSLKQPDSSFAYSGVTYSTLRVRIAELLSPERRRERFARLRARQRAVDGMARDIAFGNSYKREVAEEQRSLNRPVSSERKKELLKKIRDKRRVAFFGNGHFGHGARGPCPRKALIRALGLICPVLLIDEFRTSKCCFGCGVSLKQVDGSRVFRCCTSQTDEGRDCSVGHVDRDTNGAVNIGVCGVSLILGLARPSFLCRNESSGEECA